MLTQNNMYSIQWFRWDSGPTSWAGNLDPQRLAVRREVRTLHINHGRMQPRFNLQNNLQVVHINIYNIFIYIIENATSKQVLMNGLYSEMWEDGTHRMNEDDLRWERYGKITRKIENVNMLELFTFLFCKSVPLEATRQKILQRQGMEFLALSRKSHDADWVLRAFFVLEGSRGRIETKLYLDTHMNI